MSVPGPVWPLKVKRGSGAAVLAANSWLARLPQQDQSSVRRRKNRFGGSPTGTWSHCRPNTPGIGSP